MDFEGLWVKEGIRRNITKKLYDIINNYFNVFRGEKKIKRGLRSEGEQWDGTPVEDRSPVAIWILERGGNQGRGLKQFRIMERVGQEARGGDEELGLYAGGYGVRWRSGGGKVRR